MGGFGRLHRLAQGGVVGRNIAPAEQFHADAGALLGIKVHDLLPQAIIIMRQEQHDNGVTAGLRKRETEFAGLLREKLVGNLNENAGAVAGARVGPDSAAMLEILHNRQRVLHDGMRLPALDVGDETDPAGILRQGRIVKSARLSCRLESRRLEFVGPDAELCRAHPQILASLGRHTQICRRTRLVRSTG